MRARWTAVGYLALGFALSGCTETGGPDHGRARGDASCPGVSRMELGVADRKIVGVAAPYVADGALRGRDAELASSQRARREVAWTTAAKVLTAVPLAESLPSGASLPGHIPAWQTWYDLDDLRRVFQRVYSELPREAQQDRAHFAEADLDAALLWNPTAVDELSTWPADRYQSYLEAIDEEGEVAGLGGISRVSYSPAAARHLLQSYPEVLRCRERGAPPAQDVGPLVETPVAREILSAGACEQVRVGAYALAEDESLHAELEGGDATLTLRAGDALCEATPGTECELPGPATVEVFVTAGAAPAEVTVSLARHSSRPAWAACLDDAFPIDAVVVKADYRRADFEMTLPVYETSAEALSRRLKDDVSWEGADGEADPPPSDIYTLTLPNGAHYRLAALHIMSKELDHWLWTTLWWSPSPSVDFGADRPAAIEALGGPWGHYKMCVATAFEEGDESPDGGFRESHPSLADALEVVHSGIGAPSWCSNPYLEEGHGNAGTNCIGCHQHGGSQLLSEDILLFDERGRTQLRNNFPADYSWATTSGDNLAQLFADVELYHLGSP